MIDATLKINGSEYQAFGSQNDDGSWDISDLYKVFCAGERIARIAMTDEFIDQHRFKIADALQTGLVAYQHHMKEDYEFESSRA